MRYRDLFEALVSFDSKVFTAYPAEIRISKSETPTGVSRRPVLPRSVLPLQRSNGCEAFLLRKEVIQPQVPLRLPCYDFIPVTTHTLGHCLLAVGACTSGTSDFHDVTGGVYKARERIHGVVADTPLLAIPASWRRVAASNPN